MEEATKTHITHNLSVQTKNDSLILHLDSHLGAGYLAPSFGATTVHVMETLEPQQAINLFKVWLDQATPETRQKAIATLFPGNA